MRWKLLPEPDPEITKSLANSLSVENEVAKLLVSRGISSFEMARDFFRPTLLKLHDPFLMKDMEKAVFRILSAVENNENILVFGDYDVDGTTSVALMSTYLRSFYPNVTTYIPDRYSEGYGVSYKGIDYADDNSCGLIIALDCGIKSIDHVAYAKQKNIDFIICDHHRPGDKLPEAVAVLDPKRDDCNYPYKELCGCGVGFKLIQALSITRAETLEQINNYLDLVATAIAADIVPMTGENRILSKFGLDVINASPRTGIAAMIKPLKKKSLTISDVVFIIAPRINAAGRIRHGHHAVDLLIENDVDQAAKFALEIEQYNKERKVLDTQITAEALAQIEENHEKDRFTTVVYQEDWHKGVIGIVASRLIETHYRPTLVFTKSNDKLAASARSVLGFDVYNALESCADHLEQFGGHRYAAGMTMNQENYEAFKERFEEVVSTTIAEEFRTPEITIDAEIELSAIDFKFYRILKQFEPFGPENMTPVFLARNLTDSGFGKAIGKNQEHLKLFVKQENSSGFAAVGFGLAEKLHLTKDNQLFDAVFCVEENEFNGHVSLQLRIKDIRKSEY